MESKNPKIILEKLENTLKNNDIDFEKDIDNLGQVHAVKKRANGHQFTLQDHLKGLILSLLINQRPWKPIADNLDNLDEIFLNYEPEKLKKADPEELVNNIKRIKCGNISIKRQMKTLNYNISIFEKIEVENGSIDTFITSKPAEKVADRLSNSTSPYKLKQMGIALTMEYLKNVGISGMKPDTHLLRICGPERLNIIPKTKPKKQLSIFKKFSEEAGVSTTYLDNLIWILGANDFGEICSNKPKCHKCELKAYCNYHEI